VQDVNAPALVARELCIARDRRALGDRRNPGEAQGRRDRALVNDSVARERRVLLVQSQHESCQPLVLKRLAHAVGVGDGKSVVAEAGRPLCRQLGHLGELGSGLALGDRRQEADRHDSLVGCPLLQ
jgi:hypothetical protein